MPVSELDFLFITDLLQKKLGIQLEKDKSYLVESRLIKVAQRAGFTSLEQLILLLRANNPPQLILDETLEAMTTNETYFFRDAGSFDILNEKVLPELIGSRRDVKTLNIWSAACSTGQEAYSIAITIKEAFPFLADWNIQITGTDVAEKVVNRARDGIFNQTEIARGISPKMLLKYFTRTGEDWRLREDIRKMVTFRTMNLISDWPYMPNMDIVFLRNVLIYFDEKSRKAIFSRMHNLLRSDGYLFLGAAETTFNLSDLFARIDWERAGCFRPL